MFGGGVVSVVSVVVTLILVDNGITGLTVVVLIVGGGDDLVVCVGIGGGPDGVVGTSGIHGTHGDVVVYIILNRNGSYSGYCGILC